MYEANKHINIKIAQFKNQEDAFYRSVKKYADLPELIKGFENIPEQLKEDEQFL